MLGILVLSVWILDLKFVFGVIWSLDVVLIEVYWDVFGIVEDVFVVIFGGVFLGIGIWDVLVKFIIFFMFLGDSCFIIFVVNFIILGDIWLLFIVVMVFGFIVDIMECMFLIRKVVK